MSNLKKRIEALESLVHARRMKQQGAAVTRLRQAILAYPEKLEMLRRASQSNDAGEVEQIHREVDAWMRETFPEEYKELCDA